jgi:tripartite motif-containing protein 71
MKGRRLAVASIAAIGVVLASVPMAQGASGTWERAWGKDVVSVGGNTGFEICVFASDCKAGLATGQLGGELASPAAVAVDSANVYVADANHDRIQRQSLAGIFSRTWGKDVLSTGGGGDLEVCLVAANCKAAAASTGLGGEMNAPEGVAVDPSGDVYVSERLNNRIEKFDEAGGFIAAWGRDVVKTGGAGDVSTTAYEICTVEADCQTGDSGGIGGAFNAPSGIAADGSFVYVVDRVNNRIQKFTHAGTFLRTWGKDVVVASGNIGFEVCTVAANCKAGAASTGLGGELDFPVAVASDGVGNVYVADTFGNQVQKFNNVGVWERTWGNDVVAGGATGPEVCTVAAGCKEGDSSTDLGGEFNQPIGIAADATGVFVSDPYKHRIQEFDPSGRFFLAWGKDVDFGGATGFESCSAAASCKSGSSGGLGGEMQLPGGLSLGAGVDLYVADSGNNRIQRFGVEPPVFPPPASTTAPPPSSPAAKKKCKRKKHKRTAAAAKKKCKKKRKK